MVPCFRVPGSAVRKTFMLLAARGRTCSLQVEQGGKNEVVIEMEKVQDTDTELVCFILYFSLSLQLMK